MSNTLLMLNKFQTSQRLIEFLPNVTDQLHGHNTGNTIALLLLVTDMFCRTLALCATQVSHISEK